MKKNITEIELANESIKLRNSLSIRNTTDQL